MASTDSPIIRKFRQAILDEGFCYQGDPMVGRRVDEIAANGFPFKKEEGLKFCKINTFDDKRSCAILESIFAWSGLGCYKALGDSPRAYSFLNNPRPEVQALIIQLWSSNSRFIYYMGSHIQNLAAEPAANGFLEIPPRNLVKNGIERVEVIFDEGGWAIIDARLGFTITQGLVINLGFATKEELKEWATMKLPKQPVIEELINAMSREKIGNNFELVTP